MDNLGSQIDSLTEQERSLFVKALMKHKSDPRDSINNAGQALEDSLRDFAAKYSVDVSKKKGIIEILNEIKNKQPALLHTKQVDILEGLGAIRNMAAHSQDKITNKHWEISEIIALTFCLLSLRCVYSVIEYTSNNSQKI